MEALFILVATAEVLGIVRLECDQLVVDVALGALRELRRRCSVTYCGHLGVVRVLIFECILFSVIFGSLDDTLFLFEAHALK